MATAGNLALTVVEARLTRDTETFGKMDPYCKIATRQQQFRTATKNGAGKTPVFNETFQIDVKYIGDDMTLEVYDEDPGSDDKVGEASIKLSALCVGHGLDEWFSIQWKGKVAGQVHLKSVWHPAGAAAHPSGGAAAAHPAGGAAAHPGMQPGMMAPPMPMMQPGMMPPQQQPMMGGAYGMPPQGMMYQQQQPMMMQPGMHGQPQMYGQPPMHGQPQMYGQPQMHGQPQMYGQPQMHGQPQMYGQPQMHGQPMMVQPGMHPQGMYVAQPHVTVVHGAGHGHHGHHGKHKKYKHKKFKLKKFF